MSKTIRKERDYGKGFIYKLKCLDPKIKDIYVGSSINEVQRRKNHKERCNNPKSEAYNKTAYQFIRAHGGWDNWKMVIIKLYPCKSKQELEIEEERVREELEEFASLNRQRLSGIEYGLPKQEYNKKYRNTYKEELAEKRKEKYTCGCGALISRINLARHETSEKHKTWLKTGEQTEMKGEQYTCECGSTLTKTHKARHETSQKHQKWLASQK